MKTHNLQQDLKVILLKAVNKRLNMLCFGALQYNGDRRRRYENNVELSVYKVKGDIDTTMMAMTKQARNHSSSSADFLMKNAPTVNYKDNIMKNYTIPL